MSGDVPYVFWIVECKMERKSLSGNLAHAMVFIWAALVLIPLMLPEFSIHAPGRISPQYHVVLDNLFQTVPNSDAGGIINPDSFDSLKWTELVVSNTEQYWDNEDPPPPLADEWPDCDKRQNLLKSINSRLQARIKTPSQPPMMSPEGGPPVGDVPMVDEPLVPPLSPTPLPFPTQPWPSHLPAPMPLSPVPPAPSPTSCCSSIIPQDSSPDYPRCHVRCPHCLIEEEDSGNVVNILAKRKICYALLDAQHIAGLDWTQTVDHCCYSSLKTLVYMMAQNTDTYFNTDEEMCPMILSAKANDADHPTLFAAMNDPDKDGY